jgi:peptidoglycan/LPS O-acetylase OafA/YrhL
MAVFAITQSASIVAILGPLQYSAIYLLLALLLDSSVSQSKRSLPSLLLNNPVAAFLGGLSYSLYLWQQPFMNPNTDAWWTQAPQGLLLAIGAAMVSHYAVEKPFMRMRRAVERKKKGTNSVTTENSAVPTAG